MHIQKKCKIYVNEIKEKELGGNKVKSPAEVGGEYQGI